MNTQEFITELVEELEFESKVGINTNFKELEEWDSMGSMIMIGFVSDNFGITLTGEDIKELTTFKSLIEKIGIDKFN